MEHWTTNQQFVVPLNLCICVFQPLEVLVLVRFDQCLAPHMDRTSSVAGFSLIFQLSENRDAPDPLWHSFISFTTCLWTFEMLILVRSIKSSGNKQRKRGFTTNNEKSAQQSFASVFWWNKMKQVLKLCLLNINLKLLCLSRWKIMSLLHFPTCNICTFPQWTGLSAGSVYIYISYLIICQLCVAASPGKIEVAILGGAKWGYI